MRMKNYNSCLNCFVLDKKINIISWKIEELCELS